MAWRLVVEKEVVEQFNETINYNLMELENLEGIIKQIRRYHLDPKSKSYFEFLESTVYQMRSMLEKGQFVKRKDGGYGTQ